MMWLVVMVVEKDILKYIYIGREHIIIVQY